jgi:large subunit ribosomal protein L3
MKKFILGTKQEMTQYFAEDGRAFAATAVRVEPIVVTQVKNLDTDGYTAVQVGSGTRNQKNINKPQLGAWKDLGDFSVVREFRLDDISSYKKGDTIGMNDALTIGQGITVTGISKGKGFQGVVKRHGFAGGRRSHGQKHSEREPGSIGAGGVQRVFKGTRMAGRMGTDRISVKNLEVLAMNPETNTILIKGAVPGRRGTLLEIVTQ